MHIRLFRGCSYDHAEKQSTANKPPLSGHESSSPARTTALKRRIGRRGAASASVRLFSEFAGKKLTQRTTAIFYDPKRMCGALTFTRWVDANGDGGRLIRSGRSCFFAPGIP